MSARLSTCRLVKGGKVLLPRVEQAVGMLARMRGLLGRPGLEPDQAMHITPCTSIHTWFMRFDLDVAFLSREGEVVRVVCCVRPWRMVLGGRGARSVIEMPSGTLDAIGLSEGDEVAWE